MYVGIAALLTVLIAFMVQSLLVMLLWNWVVPRIWVNIPTLTFSNAMALVLLVDVFTGVMVVPSFMHVISMYLPCKGMSYTPVSQE